MVKFDPDQDLGLFWPKQHRPHCQLGLQHVATVPSYTLYT